MQQQVVQITAGYTVTKLEPYKVTASCNSNNELLQTKFCSFQPAVFSIIDHSNILFIIIKLDQSQRYDIYTYYVLSTDFRNNFPIIPFVHDFWQKCYSSADVLYVTLERIKLFYQDDEIIYYTLYKSWTNTIVVTYSICTLK